MPTATLLLFIPACFALNMAPGPNNLLSVSNATRYGFRAACAGGLGRLLAFAGMIALASVGLAVVLHTSEWLFGLIKLAGAAYLLYLAVQLWRAPVADGTAGDAAAAAPAVSVWALARQEFWVAAGNPKAILIFTAFLPQFTVPQHYVLSYVEVAVAFLVLEIAAIALYALLGMRMARSAGQGRIMRWFNKASGTMMVCFGVVLALMRRPGA